MSKTGIGSVIKFNMSVDGLGDYTVGDDAIGVTVDFYSSADPEKVVTADKTSMYVPEDDDSVLVVKCDTTGLDEGLLCAKVTLSYPDAQNTAETLVEVNYYKTDITLITGL